MRRLLCCTLLGLCLATPTNPRAAPDTPPLLTTLPLTGHVYILDPGHGGSDPGTKRKADGLTWNEKQFTLGLTIELTKQIRALGGTVVTTVVPPDSVLWLPFEQNRVPAQGAEYFNTAGQPLIDASRAGMTKRLNIAQRVLDQYPERDVHWLSIHFDYVPKPLWKPEISGTRIFYSAETQDTTSVQVRRLIKTTKKVHGRKVTTSRWATRDSVISIQPPSFVLSLAQAFLEAAWLRPQEQRPVVISGKVKFLFVLHGQHDPKKFGRRRHSQAVYNRVVDRVLIEYANFKSDTDWARLHQPEGSLHRLAEITVQGLLLDSKNEVKKTQRGP